MGGIQMVYTAIFGTYFRGVIMKICQVVILFYENF